MGAYPVGAYHVGAYPVRAYPGDPVGAYPVGAHPGDPVGANSVGAYPESTYSGWVPRRPWEQGHGQGRGHDTSDRALADPVRRHQWSPRCPHLEAGTLAAGCKTGTVWSSLSSGHGVRIVGSAVAASRCTLAAACTLAAFRDDHSFA